MITCVFIKRGHKRKYMYKTIEVLRELEKYPIFDLNSLKAIIGKESAYAKVYLNRLKNSGLVFEVERNKYTVHKNAFLIASRVLWPSYISFWSALRFYNLTEQVPQSVSVATTRKRKKSVINFIGVKITFTHIDKKYFFGFRKMNYDSIEIFIAEPEKAILDSIAFGEVSEQEMLEILKKNKKEINFRKLLAFANRTKSKEIIKAVKALIDKTGD